MHKAVSGAFVGAVVGAGVAAFQAKSTDAAPEDQMPAIVKGAAEGALAGCVVGSFVQWRVNRRARDVGLRGISRRAARRADHVRGRVLDAADDLLPHVEELATRTSTGFFGLADAARPHVESLAEVAREKAFDIAGAAIDAARPQLETAAEVARHRARQLSPVA